MNSDKSKIYKNFIIGGFAGGLSRSITSPLEVIKVLQQNYPNTYGKQSITSILKNTVKSNGIKSLFKGNYTNCLRIIPQNAIQLAGYNYSLNILNKLYPSYNNLNNFNAGATAGIVGYTVIYPLELIRSKLSVNIDSKTKNYNNFYSAFKYTYKKDGLFGLYKGWRVSIIGMIPYQGTTFLTYKYINNTYNPTNNKLINLISGSLAGFTAVSLTYPFDVIKRKYHLTGEMGNKNYINYTDIIRSTYDNYGIKGFYRGLFACYTKIIPSSAIFFFTVELCNEDINVDQ